MKKKLFEIKYEYDFVHCGDPWQECHHLIIFEDGSVSYEDFMDDRIPYTIKKTIKNDCADFLTEDLKELFEKYKSEFIEYQGCTFENYGNGFNCFGNMKISGYKKFLFNIRNKYRVEDVIEKEKFSEKWMKDFLDEITNIVNRYCLETLSISHQLGYVNNSK